MLANVTLLLIVVILRMFNSAERVFLLQSVDEEGPQYNHVNVLIDNPFCVRLAYFELIRHEIGSQRMVASISSEDNSFSALNTTQTKYISLFCSFEVCCRRYIININELQ